MINSKVSTFIQTIGLTGVIKLFKGIVTIFISKFIYLFDTDFNFIFYINISLYFSN